MTEYDPGVGLSSNGRYYSVVHADELVVAVVDVLAPGLERFERSVQTDSFADAGSFYLTTFSPVSEAVRGRVFTLLDLPIQAQYWGGGTGPGCDVRPWPTAIRWSTASQLFATGCNRGATPAPVQATSPRRTRSGSTRTAASWSPTERTTGSRSSALTVSTLGVTSTIRWASTLTVRVEPTSPRRCRV
jgi:hypothetical protein